MTDIIMMLLAFLILMGVVCFYNAVINANMGEGMLLSASTIMLVLAVSSTVFGTFRYGMWGICGIALLGAGGFLICLIRKENKKEQFTGWIVIGSLLLLYLFWLVIYHNDFIQHIDEFHEWAAAVKYMLIHDKMPTGGDFIGGGGQYGFASSVFLLYFQKFTGYSEQNMYVASTLLTFIGLLLPFSNYEKKDGKKVWIYIGILYIALYSLYVYGTKSLYVDMPTAAWAGGLAGWWMNRDPGKKKCNVLILLAGMVTLHFMKQSQGLLMAVFVLLFVLSYSWMIEKKRIYKPQVLQRLRITTGVLCLLILIGTAGVVLLIGELKPVEKTVVSEDGQEYVTTYYEIMGKELPQGAANWIDTYTINGKKAKETMKSFLTNGIGNRLTSRSNLKLAFVPFVILCLMLTTIYGDLYQKKQESSYFRCYMLVMSLAYSAVLYLSFVLLFTYGLSVDVKSSARYFSGCAVYLFMLVMTLLLSRENLKRKTALKYVLCGIGAMFLYGVNTKYIPNMTALDKDEVIGYESISSAKHQVQKIQKQIGMEDKVYFIYQVSEKDFEEREYVNSPVLYYMDTQVSNYMGSPWRFLEEGCNIGLELREDITLQNLPDLLTWGGYTYVWIYKSNSYLNENLPEVFQMEEDVEKGLYKVIYENERPVGLEYVSAL